MVMWTKNDNANGVPSFAPALIKQKANTANRTNMYANNLGASTGIFAADSTEVRVRDGIASPGWQLRKVGKGQIRGITVTAPGTGYSNTGVVTVVATEGANAVGSVVTNGAGAIQSVNITTTGGYFVSKTPTVVISGMANTATGATLLASVGGKAGRVQIETLVAMSNITGDGADDTVLPDA